MAVFLVLKPNPFRDSVRSSQNPAGHRGALYPRGQAEEEASEAEKREAKEGAPREGDGSPPQGDLQVSQQLQFQREPARILFLSRSSVLNLSRKVQTRGQTLGPPLRRQAQVPRGVHQELAYQELVLSALH